MTMIKLLVNQIDPFLLLSLFLCIIVFNIILCSIKCIFNKGRGSIYSILINKFYIISDEIDLIISATILFISIFILHSFEKLLIFHIFIILLGIMVLIIEKIQKNTKGK